MAFSDEGDFERALKFMPPEKRNSKDSYQGPKYSTFKGERTERRS